MVEAELVGAWRDILERYHATWGALDRALRERHQLGATEFEVLDQLAEVPADDCADCRMQDLGSRVQLSQSALSRVVSRLEQDGLVTRSMCADDRRGIFVALTSTGRARHAEAMSTHRSVLAENLS
ncbi:MAG TPA: MarR family transcriptional regulator [Pseudonocardiaceae bacterium]|jgi:DNA-binding MarR family transcriptional regulator|nr:MarR family transcriptional regulator [Pseudonocardiaceae bacterium]